MSRGKDNASASIEGRQLNRSTSRVGRKARGAIGAGLGFASLLTVLILAAPLASASGIVSMSAPYTGWTSTSSNYMSSSGCAAARESAAPSWSSSTGLFTFAGRANASTCGSSYNYGSVYGVTTITSAGFSGTHGHTSYVYLTWNMSIATRAALSFTPGGSYSYAYASVSGTAYAYLIDVTNGSYTFITSAYSTLFGATLSSSGLYVLQTGWVTSYQYMTATLLKGHVYEVVLSIYVSGVVSLYGGSGSGSAAVGLAGSHGLGLASVTVY